MLSPNYQPHNLLITGGSGFIGINFIKYVLNLNPAVRIINLDKLTYASQNVQHHNPHYIFVEGDISHAEQVAYVLRHYQIDSIIHLAAESHVDRSIADPASFIMTNIVGTFVLLDAVKHFWLKEKKWNHQHCRFHHVSTDEVYGALKSADSAFHESSSYAPNSPYSASKASSDHLVRAYHHTYQLPVTISHCSNNYGPYQHTEKFIPTIIRSCEMQQPIPIYGDGSQIRDWLYVTDHCAGIYKILQAGEIGETYHLGGNNQMSNLDVAQLICGWMDEIRPNRKSHAELITLVNDRPGHDWRYAMNTQKIREKLAWSPVEDFVSGIKKTLSFYLEHVLS